MSLTIGEEIEKFKQDYEKGDKKYKFIAGNLAAAEFYKAQQIWEYIESQIKSQGHITREEAFPEENERGLCVT